MGGKKTKRKAPPKKAAPKLETQFDCPFCFHQNSCDVKMFARRVCENLILATCMGSTDARQRPEVQRRDRDVPRLLRVVPVHDKLCAALPAAAAADPAADLSEPIDVYSNWIDQCESAKTGG